MKVLLTADLINNLCHIYHALDKKLIHIKIKFKILIIKIILAVNHNLTINNFIVI